MPEDFTAFAAYLKNFFDTFPYWKAVVDPTGPVTFGFGGLDGAARKAKEMVDAGQKVVALTDGEFTIEGDDLSALLADPDAIHMHDGKLYDTSLTYTLGSGLRR